MRKNNEEPIIWTKDWFLGRIEDILLNFDKDNEWFIQCAIWWEVFSLEQCLENYDYLTWWNWWETLFNTLHKKNSDYSWWDNAFSNLCLCESIGINPKDWIKVRMCDKVSRIRNLVNKEPEVIGESLADSWLDLAWYLVLLYLYEEYEANQWRQLNLTQTNSEKLEREWKNS